jgi:hypothetical protein
MDKYVTSKTYTGKPEKKTVSTGNYTNSKRFVLCSCERPPLTHLLDTMSILTGNTHHRSWLMTCWVRTWLTTGTVMPSRKEMPEPLQKNKTGKMR